MSHDPARRRRRWLRGFVLVSAVLYMQVGSTVRMGLGIPTGPMFQSWRMYHSRGHDQCKLTTYRHEKSGRVVPFDWAEKLRWPLGDKRRRIEGVEDAEDVAHRLCKTVRRGMGVSLVLQCAEDRRWVPPNDTRGNVVCVGGRR